MPVHPNSIMKCLDPRKIREQPDFHISFSRHSSFLGIITYDYPHNTPFFFLFFFFPFLLFCVFLLEDEVMECSRLG